MNIKHILIICALLVSIGGFAQGPVTADSISSMVLDYYSKVPQEKIFVHTDRDFYEAGDTVWFRAYVVDAATNRLCDRSKFVYLELLDNAADTLIRRIKIKADSSGIFANALPLASRMKSGSYTLAAYTRWMQNFGEDMFFKKKLNVVNPADSIDPSPWKRRVNAIALDVMPEGGNLLAGRMQRVAYKAVGDDGLGVDVEVRLVNAGGDVLKEGVSQHLGMGFLPVNVDAGEELWLEAFTRDGLSCRTKLPEAMTEGVTLSVNQHKGNLLIQPYATPSIDIKGIALVLYGSGNLMVKELSDNSTIRISSRDLAPGVINIALIDRMSRQPLAERLIFVRDSDPVNFKMTLTDTRD